MKKSLFVIIACCFAVSTAFAQSPFDFHLNEDKSSDEKPLEINGYVQGHFVIKTIGEPDEEGFTPVQIELQHSSNEYEFLLFDWDWPQKELRKQCVVLNKNLVAKDSQSVKKVELLNKGNINEVERYSSYIFPVIRIPEDGKYECKIPIHLAKTKFGLFCSNKKKIYDILYCTIKISVDNRDEVYEKLENECNTLLHDFNEALDRHDFCINPLHQKPFEEQTEMYIEAKEDLVDSISSYLSNKGWPKGSKKYNRYAALLDSLNRMDVALENYNYDCGEHQPKKQISCRYCKLSLEDIWKRMNRLYLDLYIKKKQKPEVLKEAKALYNCGTNHKKQERQWKNSAYKKSIEDYYKSIKDY